MNGKKWIALVLALVLAVTAVACGKTTHVEAYDATPPMDLDAAFAAFAPDTVILYVEGEPVTWQELFYEIVYFVRQIEASDGTNMYSWDQLCTSMPDGEGNLVSYGNLALQNALLVLTQYHTIHSRLTQAGVTLGDEARAAVESARSSVIEQRFGGDEQAYLDYLAELYGTDELATWFNEVDALYQYDGFVHFYGELGSLLPDEDVFAYAAGDPNGNWTEYVQLKQIVLYDGEAAEAEEPAETEVPAEEEAPAASEEPTDEASGEATDETAAAPAEETPAAEPAQDPREAAIEAALAGAGDTATASGEASNSVKDVFFALYGQYNEEPALDYFPDGRAVYRGDTQESVYAAALALGEYEWKRVPADDATVYILRMPLDPDAGVLYDMTTETLFTLRYFAALQRYSDMINGDGGWLATATASWAEGFENFRLTD